MKGITGGGQGSEFTASGARQSSVDGVVRLLDEPLASGTSARQRALELLQCGAPYQESPTRKERVAVSLTSMRLRHLPLLLRPVTVMGVMLGFGAVASAAIWRWPNWVETVYQRFTPATAPAVSSPLPTHDARSSRNRGAHHRFASTVGDDSAMAVDVDAMLSTAAPPLTTATDYADRTSARKETLGRPRVRHPSSLAAAGDDTSPVLGAMRALRRDHDPVRARALLGDYLKQRPNGALAEEALALSIEAAVAQQDADAVLLARDYLRRYPSGPFRTLANRTLAATAPPAPTGAPAPTTPP